MSLCETSGLMFPTVSVIFFVFILAFQFSGSKRLPLLCILLLLLVAFALVCVCMMEHMKGERCTLHAVSKAQGERQSAHLFLGGLGG